MFIIENLFIQGNPVKAAEAEPVINRSPKGISLKTMEGFRVGTTQICLGNENMAERGGSRKSSNVIREDQFSEVTFKGGSAKFHFA